MTESSGVSRRGFFKFAGMTAGAVALGGPTLAACGKSSGGSSGGGGGGTLKFWDQPWGVAAYSDAAKALTEAYKPANGLPSATYQVIQWANFTQTYSSAIASKTGPAVSSGGGLQAFQFAAQGAIAYADNLISKWKTDKTYDDFLPGLVDQLKTDKGYVAVPSQLDMRVFWYRKSLFDQNGLKPPTTWNEYMTVATALGKKGLFAFGTGSGAGNNLGAQALLSMMINNGGGLFNANDQLDCVTPRNIETLDYVKELFGVKAIDPASVSYTTDNLQTQWKTKKVAMGNYTPGLDTDLTDTSGDLLVMDPMTGPHGDKGTISFLNNLMMYTETPSQAGSEAFLDYYIKNMKVLWTKKVIPQLPILKSIVATPEFQASTQKVKCINDWVPIAKTYAAQGHKLGPLDASIDAGQALNAFTQSVLSGKADSRTVLAKLQSDIAALQTK